jgi:hypothetical protein
MNFFESTELFIFVKYFGKSCAMELLIALSSSSLVVIPESIEWFLEEQAFSLSYDLALPPLSHPHVVSLSQ